jgi:hypothetical protein
MDTSQHNESSHTDFAKNAGIRSVDTWVTERADRSRRNDEGESVKHTVEYLAMVLTTQREILHTNTLDKHQGKLIKNVS